MIRAFKATSILLPLGLAATFAQADEYASTIEAFRNAGESGQYFDTSVGYAVFPTIGKGGIGIGGAYGKGQVYKGGELIGKSSMAQATIGLQLGGQAYSQIIFLEDERAFNEFTGGNFEFGAQATAVAITAGASASSSTTGNTAGASGGKNNAALAGAYQKGYAIFTVAKGGPMYEASIGGQKFSYKAK